VQCNRTHRENIIIMHVLILWQSGLDSSAAPASGVKASAASAVKDPPEVDADDDEQNGEMFRSRKKKKRKAAEDNETGLAKILKENAHLINEELIPSALAMLGCDMHEGGSAKKVRDKLYFRVVAALDVGGVRERGRFEKEADDIPGRLKLIATNLQTVDQVSWQIALDILSCYDVLTLRPFCSIRGR